MRILSPRIHGVLDYVVVLALILAPTLLGFGGTPRVICYVLAAVQLTMSVLTAYPAGIVKAIPFTVHGGVEAATAVFLLVMPWIFRFSHVNRARDFFVASAIVLAVVWLITDYKAAGYPRVHGPKRPSPA